MKCVCLTCQRFQKFDPSWYSACLCIVVPVGGPYASGVLSAFVMVSRQQKRYCHVLCVIWPLMFVFFSCRINNFQVQVQVQLEFASLKKSFTNDSSKKYTRPYYINNTVTAGAALHSRLGYSLDLVLQKVTLNEKYNQYEDDNSCCEYH